MHITSQSLRTIAWSTLALSTAHAQYIIDNLSFGHKAGVYISPDLRAVPHFVVQGIDDYVPQILSDRVILTPPYPGNKRGSIWAQDPLHHKGDWTAELDFRATGMERGGGNLQFWYVRESQARETPASLYTAPKFDGLVLVIDQYEGHGGSVRGFLNDGTKDIKSHPDPDTLAFGKCDYAYRNRGELTPIKLHHAEGFLEVIVDGESCFKTDKIELPEGYYFGISASSAENPDSFEVHKFIVSTKASQEPPNPNKQDYVNSQHQQQKIAAQKGHEEQTHKQNQAQQKYGSSISQNDIPKMVEDVLAGNIQSQQDQFADLHNRIQIINNRVAEMAETIELIHKENSERWNELMHRIVPIDDRGAATIRNVEKVERTTSQILRDLESKDFKDMMNQFHRAMEKSTQGVIRSMPEIVGSVVTTSGPSMTTFLFIAVAVQIMVTGAYILYKKRRGGAPKKYL
ncbi:concanavalin A-like lectin/glucanase [Stemphylium lycopersici]|uniref:Concanavalin A-like lectin/glucanase n=1 Tax=Stemphylium lycopersici TaxID=183478 RepID=A0A364MU59_STELY|nr:lectin family integral membrane [Stemphylium lycopersici]RAR03631.1 concanavalin A-like lectin/glucanase [Stemphylium lycopersici]RAR03982.1 concanavalin A-like lectin/glucanase [Stemphylium lycopersici]